MINRELIRIKAVQLVYSNMLNDGKDVEDIIREMDESLNEAYDLYHHMLNLICEITDYAAQMYEAACTQVLQRSAHAQLPSDRFVANRFAAQLQTNRALEVFTTSHSNLRWTEHEDVVRIIYGKIVGSREYKDYMEAETSDYESDRSFWRRMYKMFIIPSEEIDEALEEWSIYWNCDRFVIDSFVIKTIKNFKETLGDDQPLMQKYNKSDDHKFGRDLLVNTIADQEKNAALITAHIRNWDYDRLAKIDVAVIATALSEITHFPDISVNISLNEYINISKIYCAPKSIKFINATLDSIVKDLRAQGKLLK